MTTSTLDASQTLPILKEGESGEAVRFLEQLLSSIYRFGLPVGKPSLIKTNVTFDAKYDSQCKQIVKSFQENYNATFPSPNIIVDGIVGPQTWKALGDAIFKYTY